MSFRFNRGLVPRATEPDARRPASALLLVQVRDADGFWCNRAEPPTVASALNSAEAIAQAEHCHTRVVRGPRRAIVREFFG
jgi:hypothetical protein